jgi:CheY-like chemotaxis protein
LKNKIRILIIDDEPIIRRAFKKLFSAPRFEVVTAEDGQTGLQKWLKDEFDFVFLDVLMPGLNGWEVLEAKSDWGKTRVQVMSAFTGDLTNREKWIQKIDGFLPKPFENIIALRKWVEDVVP